MAHLSLIQESILTADAFYIVDVTALNNSGVSGTVFATIEDSTLSIAVENSGLTPDQVHIQHIHGLFTEAGEPMNSVAPTAAQDMDLDGFVEVAEGLVSYGDILLPIEDQTDGFNNGPVASETGGLAFYGQFDLEDDSLFLNPLSGTQYTGDDLLPLDTREYVVHGFQVDQPFGAGTEGSIDGTPGYKLSLPVGAGQFEEVSQDQALDILEDVMQAAGVENMLIEGTAEADQFEGIQDGATIFGNAGIDTLSIDGARSDFGTDIQSNGLVRVSEIETGAATELFSVERVAFSDATLVYGLGDNATETYLLLQAAADAAPAEAEFRDTVREVDDGRTLDDLSAELLSSDSFLMLAGDVSTDGAFVDALYDVVLGREADAAGQAFWEGVLAGGNSGREDVFQAFAFSGENAAQEAADFEDGFLVV